MDNINTDNRASTFYPKERPVKSERSVDSHSQLRGSDRKRMPNELQERLEKDAKVEIPKKIKEFSRIKKAVDDAPIINKQEKIKALKNEISKGEYEINPEEIAQRMLSQEL